MAYLRYLGDNRIHKAKVIPEENVVTIQFENKKEISTAGFDLFLDEGCFVDIGEDSYHGFTTIYRNDEFTEAYNGYQLSNDGSVYVEPEPDPEPIPEPDPEPEPEPEPTLEETQESKIAEMNSIQQQIIQNGVDVILSDGSIEHFTLKDQDQTSLMGLQTKVLVGEGNIPWHTADETEHCKFYSNTDMALITTAAMNYVTWHVTYFRDIRIYIRSLQTKEEVESVFYGMDIPEEYQSEPLKAMIAAQIL